MNQNDLLFVTGASGLVGSHVAERARSQNIRTRALVRNDADARVLEKWGVECVRGDLTDADALRRAVQAATVIVHCAAKVGDWGPVESYRSVNVDALRVMLDTALSQRTLRRFVHISSLGVYEARDHYGTDESVEPSATGIDGYTLTKFEAERLVLDYVRSRSLPAVVLRPGFIYGPRDRAVLPNILGRLKSGQFAFLGSGDRLLNNTYVGNLVDAIFLAIDAQNSIGRIYNITDGKLVTKRDFVSAIVQQAGYAMPKRHIPLPLARMLAKLLERIWRLRGKQEAPLLSNARIKFLGLNLDFCIDRAKRELGYRPQVEFEEGMRRTVTWFREQGRV